MRTIPATEVRRLTNALPFWLSLVTVPLAVFGALQGGWAVVLLPVYSWGMFSVLDALIGLNEENADLTTPEAGLFWYRAITLIWFPVQAGLLFWLIWYVPQAPHLGLAEKLVLFFGVGVISGTVGINYSHELMHQKPAAERWLGDLLLACVLYSHFRSEHLRVHTFMSAPPAIRSPRAITRGSTAISPGCCGNVRLPPFGPKRRCWRGAVCPSGIAAIRSGAMRRCRRLRWGWPLPWAAGRGWVCSCGRRALPSDSWNW